VTVDVANAGEVSCIAVHQGLAAGFLGGGFQDRLRAGTRLTGFAVEWEDLVRGAIYSTAGYIDGNNPVISANPRCLDGVRDFAFTRTNIGIKAYNEFYRVEF
jgi:hypothetical protein